MDIKQTKEYIEINKYGFKPYIMENLEQFLKAKYKRILNNEDDFLKFKFDMIYTDLKQQWVIGKISENTFWELVELLRSGV